MLLKGGFKCFGENKLGTGSSRDLKRWNHFVFLACWIIGAGFVELELSFWEFLLLLMYAEPKHWSWWVWLLGLGEEFGQFSTLCYSLLELSLGGLILITCSAGAGGFLKLSRLFMKINRWFLVRMSLNCKLSGFNGRLSTCSKLKEAKEPLHGPISVRKWRRKLLFFCLL